MAPVEGTCGAGFDGVRTAFATLFEEGLDVGASFAVVHRGELVVDLWGGSVDEAGSAPWGRDTITNVWSTTKTMTALCALILADAGDLDLHAPVASVWPEFAAAGKEAVEVRHLLGHTSGLSGWQEQITNADLEDWDKVTGLLAAQAPWWEPGTASGYHAITQGNLVGEVVRRVTGSSVGTFFAKEVAGRLGADFHIGLAPEHDHRVARVIPPPPIELPPGIPMDSVAMKTFASPGLAAEASWEPGWRRAEIPAAGGHGNARSVAQVQAVLANGGEVGGTRLLSEAGCRAVFEEQARGIDLVLGIPVRFGLGYGLNGEELPVSPSAGACFWGGWGGSLVVVDQDERLCIAYVMNKMGAGTVGDDRSARCVAATYAALAG